MKKTLIAIALAAMMAPAWGAEVVSSNIVGYDKMSLSKGLAIVGSQFVTIGDDAIDIQDLVASGAAASDEIMFFDGTSYENYTYDNSTFDEDWNELPAGWSNADGFRATRDISLGEGFWYRNSSSKDVTFSGEVNTNVTAEVSCGGKLALVSLPVPVIADIQAIKIEGIAPGDEILFFNGTNYDTFTYDASTFDEDWNELPAGWSNSEGFRATKSISVNVGFWLRAAAQTVTISL